MTTLLYTFLISAGLGIIGSLARVIANYIGALQSPHKIDHPRFFIYASVIIAIGAFMGIALSFSKPLSILGGYMGLDLVEGYYKVFKKTKVDVKK